MGKQLQPSGLFYFKRSFVTACIFILFYTGGISSSVAQQKKIEGQNFTRYKPAHFKSKRGLAYTLYLSPVLTVDPLGLGGRSTYALALGSRVPLWESKLADQARQGLRIKGLYTAIAYEYYPQQFDNIYVSLWLRIKTFMPIVARTDALYSYGGGKQGVMSRFCFGFEIRRYTILLSGTTYSDISYDLFGDHPTTGSPYANAGSIELVIPIYSHKQK